MTAAACGQQQQQPARRSLLLANMMRCVVVVASSASALLYVCMGWRSPDSAAATYAPLLQQQNQDARRTANETRY